MAEPYWMTGKGDGSEARPFILWDDGDGLITLDDEGQWYTNQTGGVACHHPIARGHFQPFAVPVALASLLCDCMFGISEDEAARADAIFVKYGLPMRVDRDYLQQSEEAWLYVALVGGGTGILTWENSD